MTIHIRGYCERAAQPAEPGTPIRFVASTEGVARDGFVIEAAGWDLGNYRANPVVLWSHDYGGRTLPIGRADVELDGKRLMADVTFDPDDEFAQQVERKYRNGFLSAVSVGWNTVEVMPPKGAQGAPRITRAELLDISAVPVPSDPKALKERQIRALETLGREFLTLTDTDSDDAPDELDWQGTALQMLRLCSPAASDLSDAERKRLYDRLEARYRRAGKTAPELLDIAHLEALDGDTWRGLWFHDEPDLLPDWFPAQRAGAVLSKRNADDLTQAVRLIDGVIQRAAKEDATGDDGDSEQRNDDGQRALLDALNGLNRALGVPGND